MDIRVNQLQQAAQTAESAPREESTGEFKFILTSRVADEGLAERLNTATTSSDHL